MKTQIFLKDMKIFPSHSIDFLTVPRGQVQEHTKLILNTLYFKATQGSDQTSAGSKAFLNLYCPFYRLLTWGMARSKHPTVMLLIFTSHHSRFTPHQKAKHRCRILVFVPEQLKGFLFGFKISSPLPNNLDISIIYRIIVGLLNIFFTFFSVHFFRVTNH